MNKKTYTTSFCFPVVKCDLRIESNKVKQPSGIMYILLELIKSYRSRATLLKDELLLFGIPEELHYIFSREVVFLCDQNIITFRGSNVFNEVDFNSCYIHEFDFSDFGLRVFKEGAIPTDERRKYNFTLYYDMVTKMFQTPEALKGKLEKAATSIYSDFKYPEINNEMIIFEDIFEDNRKQFKAKPEEIFKDGAIIGEESIVYEIDDCLKVDFNYNKVSFKFDDVSRNNFLKERLNGNMLENHFLKQRKFDFERLLHEKYSIPEKNEIPMLGDVMDIHMPYQMPELLRRKATIVFDRNLFIMNKADKKSRIGKELSDRVLNAVDSCVVGALVDKDDIRLFCPIRMSFFNDVLSEYVPINVIYEIKANDEISEKLFKEAIEYVFNSEFTPFNAKFLSLIAEVNNNEDLLENYLCYIKEQNQKDYGNLVCFNSIVKKEGKWKETFRNFVNAIFEENKTRIKEDNLTEIHNLLKPLKDIMDISDVEFIKYLTANIDIKENYSILFYIFEQYEYKPENIMISINIVELYMKNILNGEGIDESFVKNKIENDFIKVELYFDNLKKLLGIESYLDFVKESFDKEKIQDNYKAFVSAYKAIEKYRSFASDEFVEIDEYMKVFEAVHEVVVMEISAMKDAKAITKEYIENLILKADLKNAICDMHVRLQDFVLDYYNEKIYSSKMIEQLVEDNVINEETKNILFQLIKCRNSLQHPKNMNVNLSKEDVAKWCNVLYKVIEGDAGINESSGKN